jgi:hypothetical protein
MASPTRSSNLSAANANGVDKTMTAKIVSLRIAEHSLFETGALFSY